MDTGEKERGTCERRNTGREKGAPGSGHGERENRLTGRQTNRERRTAEGWTSQRGMGALEAVRRSDKEKEREKRGNI